VWRSQSEIIGQHRNHRRNIHLYRDSNRQPLGQPDAQYHVHGDHQLELTIKLAAYQKWNEKRLNARDVGVTERTTADRFFSSGSRAEGYRQLDEVILISWEGMHYCQSVMETGQTGDTTYLFDSKEDRNFGEPQAY